MPDSLPKSAFIFESLPVAPSRDGARDGFRQFQGTVYSGLPIRDHAFWDAVIIDISSTQAAEKLPVLMEHDRAKRAGFAAIALTDHKITISEGTLLNNEHGRAVAEESDAGFPWQMSMHVSPGSLEEVEPGTAVTVNGQTLQGPITVFRNNRIREVSFTPTGADDQTRAAALSYRHQENAMDVAELKRQVADLQAAVDREKNDAQARVAALQASLTESENRANQAETKLAQFHSEVRKDKVKILFAELGREYSEDKAKPYLEMSEDCFQSIAADLKAAKPKLPAGLFSEQALEGQGDEAARAATIERLSAL